MHLRIQTHYDKDDDISVIFKQIYYIFRCLKICVQVKQLMMMNIVPVPRKSFQCRWRCFNGGCKKNPICEISVSSFKFGIKFTWQLPHFIWEFMSIVKQKSFSFETIQRLEGRQWCSILYIRPKLIFNTDPAKSRSSVTFVWIIQSSWRFAQCYCRAMCNFTERLD